MLRVCLLAIGAIALAAAAGNDWIIGPFTRPPAAQPVITPLRTSVFEDPIRHAPVRWEALHTFNPAAVVRQGKIYVLYRAEDDSGAMEIGGHTSRIGLAESSDGIHFTRRPEPVLYPANDSEKSREWPGGCEDPRVVESEDGTYVLTYTQWNSKVYDTGIATSPDLVHWTKHGPMLAKFQKGKYAALKYKSAAIVTSLAGDRLIAVRIGGWYWMFWDEGHLHLARSRNLIDWDPVEDNNGKLLEVLGPRPGHFDSSFPEVGPPPILTSRGIVVLYNGKNSATEGAPGIAAGAYSVGQALFAGDDPRRVLARTDEPILRPELPFERSGQYAAGTTFAEALVHYAGKWFLYYGCADSLVGVAEAKGSL